ncbi:signal transduction histidine kinase [Vitreoscilla sp. C1]|nr:signal transduction histidine kinase [Vitreoscilla sp. C1]
MCLGLNIPLPHLLIAQAWLTLILGNILLSVYQKHDAYQPYWAVVLGLCLDWWVLTEFLFFTGGASNPLIFLYLIPVLFAALMCQYVFAIGMAIASVLAYGIMYVWYLPLISHHWLHQNIQLHFLGMWLTFGISISMMTAAVTWLMADLKQRDRLLREADRNQMRDENILWLGMNAANLAHQLSTPLNNLYLLVGEYRAKSSSEDLEDLDLMQLQLDECTQILHQLREQQEINHQPTVFDQVLEQHLNQWRNLRPQVVVQWQYFHKNTQKVILDPLFWPALFNILNNAADAGENQVSLDTRIEKGWLTVHVINEKGSLTEHYFYQEGLQVQATQKPAGLGLGIQLSHATLEKMGGSLNLFNRPQGGVQAVICVPITEL